MSIEIPLETKEIKTPSGEHNLVVRSYLTGLDKRQHRTKLYELGKEAKDEDRIKVEEDYENLKISMVVKSVDGVSEDITQRVLSMKVEDYNWIMDYVDELIEGLSKKKEVTSSTNTPTSSEEESVE